MAGERTLPGLGLTGYWTPGSDDWGDQNDVNLRLLSVIAGGYVDSTEATAPGAPTNGDIHIASASWGGGAADDIMVRDNGAWIAITPWDGLIMHDVGASQTKQFDGADWVSFGGSGAAVPYDIRSGFVATPGDGEVFDTIMVPRAITFPANFSGGAGIIGTNPTSSFAITVKDDGATIGTITIGTGGSYTFATSGGTSKAVAAGSALTFEGPGTADATAADADFTIPATVD